MKSPEMWFVIPAYRAGDKLSRCLRSVMRQKGPWKAVVAVDANDRETAECAMARDPERMVVVVRPTRLYALRNVVEAIRDCVPEEAVVAILDGDDELIGDGVVEAMLAPYEDPEVGAAWSRYVEYQGGKPFDHGSRTSGPMRDDVSPYRQPWRCSPLRTFRKSVFAKVDERNFLDGRGEWLKRAYDQALMLPTIHLSRKTVFVDKETYIYHNEPKPETSRLGEECCNHLRSRRFVGYPMDDVAAGVLTYREGPFLEHVLRWLVGMVSKVIVLEDETSMFGDQGGGDETRRVVEKVMREVPQARDVIDFRVESFGSEKGPRQEALRRNRVASIAASCGCDWVWHVDADELYDDDEAKAMWSWFRERMDGRTSLATCSMLTYWRSLHWRVQPPEPHEPVVISRVDVPAVLARQFCKAPSVEIPPEVCRMRHYSWVRTPSDVARKISGWGHAHQMREGWFESVFMKWSPGCDMVNLHPTHPEAYFSVVRCAEPLPSALADHPWRDLDIVTDGPGTKRVKAVVLHHNMPAEADRLWKSLSAAFDDVELVDCGSDPGKIPTRLTLPLPNVYWEGAWAEAMRRWSDFDAIWVVGADVQLRSDPSLYRKAIEEALPFGCWSPAIEGRAHPFMLARHYGGKRRQVMNVEGMALAVSGELVRMLEGRFEVETKIGFGQDYWFCAMARGEGLPNYIDGTVTVYHPPGIGYDEADAHRRMDEAFGARFGPHYRQTLFRYKEDFEGNLFKETQDMGDRKLTIATVENGWGVKEFNRITSAFPQCRLLIMRKGVSDFSGETPAEVIDYDPEMTEVLKADIALFPRVGAANRLEFARMFAAGIPVVVNANHHDNLVHHEVDGFIYGHESWAQGWVSKLVEDEGLRLRIGGKAAQKAKSLHGEGQRREGSKPAPASKPAEAGSVQVTVITPTFRRDPRVVSRCLDCVRLQTMSDIEQLVCSDGAPEPQIATLVGSRGDGRVSYHHTTVKKAGDFGNVVRQTMLERARGKYILFLDDDNLILPHYLERMVGAIEESGSDFAVCRVVHFGPLNESAVGRPPKVLTGLPVKLHHVDPLQVLVKREAMLDVGWDTEKGYLADGHTLQALGEKYKHVEVPEVLGFHM